LGFRDGIKQPGIEGIETDQHPDKTIAGGGVLDGV
jgi:hypothetical protein